eukprot:PhM_4_TR6458/c0_g1_i1/m.54757
MSSPTSITASASVCTDAVNFNHHSKNEMSSNTESVAQCVCADANQHDIADKMIADKKHFGSLEKYEEQATVFLRCKKTNAIVYVRNSLCATRKALALARDTIKKRDRDEIQELELEMSKRRMSASQTTQEIQQNKTDWHTTVRNITQLKFEGSVAMKENKQLKQDINTVRKTATNNVELLEGYQTVKELMTQRM